MEGYMSPRVGSWHGLFPACHGFLVTGFRGTASLGSWLHSHAHLWSTAGWSVFSILPQPVFVVLVFVFVSLFEPLLPIGVGLTAGAMIWTALAKLPPDALKQVSLATIASTVLVSVSAMLAF
jgi:zinc transporter ZupT